MKQIDLDPLVVQRIHINSREIVAEAEAGTAWKSGAILRDGQCASRSSQTSELSPAIAFCNKRSVHRESEKGVFPVAMKKSLSLTGLVALSLRLFVSQWCFAERSVDDLE